MDLLKTNDAFLLDAALYYAALGWPVLPLKPNHKIPLTGNGLLDSSDNVEQIKFWWKKWPTANIGLRTGLVFDVLDLDGPEAVTTLASLTRDYYHNGPVASTGKGYHLFLKKTGSKNHVKLFDSKIDYRGDKGYVVAAPSIHPNGHKYLWKRSDALHGAPKWLYAALFPPRPQRVTPVSDPELREAIENAGDILALFAQIAPPAWKTGNRYVTYCPFHQDDTASLSIYLDTNTFFCFGCAAYGDPLNLKRYLHSGRLR